MVELLVFSLRSKLEQLHGFLIGVEVEYRSSLEDGTESARIVRVFLSKNEESCSDFGRIGADYYEWEFYNVYNMREQDF